MEKIINIYWALALIIWLSGIYTTKFVCVNPAVLKQGIILIKPPLFTRIIAGVPTLNRNFETGAVILNVFWGQYFSLVLAICNLLISIIPKFVLMVNNPKITTFYLFLMILVIALSLSGISTFVVYKTCFLKKI